MNLTGQDLAASAPPAPVDAAQGPVLPAERIGRLKHWLDRQVTLEVEEVTLPISRRRYSIAKPDQASKDRLFAAARADPDRQMPHWAKAWASGVALADVVVQRAEELAGHDVLELGAGLGTTACAILETGASLITADYSVLSLAHCRYNTLVNARRAARALRFNWRAPETPALLGTQSRGGFRLILAADVLYEGRDVFPLLRLIERLLTPDGMLWLAEPHRKTAQRFMNTVVQHGWESDSRAVYGPWPDGTTDRVNVHFLRRATFLDRLPGALAGWRI